MSRDWCPPSRRGHSWKPVPIDTSARGTQKLRQLEMRQCERCPAIGRVNSQGVVLVEKP